MAMKSYAKYGSWAFILGLVISIIAGFVTTSVDSSAALILGILGVIVGLVNVTDREIQLYLVASIALLVAASSLTVVVSFSSTAETVVRTVLRYIMAFVAPGAAIVALKAVYDISKE